MIEPGAGSGVRNRVQDPGSGTGCRIFSHIWCYFAIFEQNFFYFFKSVRNTAFSNITVITTHAYSFIMWFFYRCCTYTWCNFFIFYYSLLPKFSEFLDYFQNSNLYLHTNFSILFPAFHFFPSSILNFWCDKWFKKNIYHTRN